MSVVAGSHFGSVELPVGEDVKRQQYTENEPLLKQNRVGLTPVLRGSMGSIHVAKDRVFILAGTPHLAQIPTVGTPPPDNYPQYFSWIDHRSLFDPECPRFPTPAGYNYCDKIAVPPLPNDITTFVLPPINQSTCGNCYAVSSANATAARFAIWGLQNPVRLSYYQLTDCSSLMNKKTEAGCGGGNPADCFSYMQQYGVLSAQKYTSMMSTYPADPNNRWPAGQASFNQSSFTDPSNPKSPTPLPEVCVPKNGPAAYPFQTSSLLSSEDARGKAVQFTSIESIKAELFNNGPVVAMYKCWDDFNAPNMGGMHMWPETNNIYIRRAYRSRSTGTTQDFIKKYRNSLNVNFSSTDITTFETLFRGGWKSYWKDADTMMDGTPKSDTDVDVIGHAIMIVGWGVDNNVPGYGKLEYWIVQNSWGDSWNDNGYFKIAMSHQKDASGVYGPRSVNDGVGIDVMTDGEYGGVFAWKPRLLDDKKNPIAIPKMPADAKGIPIPLVPSHVSCPAPSPSYPSNPITPVINPITPVTPVTPSYPINPITPGTPLEFHSLPFFKPSPPSPPPNQQPSPPSPPSPPPSPPSPSPQPPPASPSPPPASPSAPPPPPPSSSTSFWNRINLLEKVGIGLGVASVVLLLGWIVYMWSLRKRTATTGQVPNTQTLPQLPTVQMSQVQPPSNGFTAVPLPPVAGATPTPPNLLF